MLSALEFAEEAASVKLSAVLVVKKKAVKVPMFRSRAMPCAGNEPEGKTAEPPYEVDMPSLPSVE